MPLIQTEDGFRLFVRQDGRRSAPAVILSNALGTTHAMWEPQVEALAAKFHLIRYDGRGHGKSDAPVGEYTISRLARDAVNVLDALGVRRASFVGLSLGGTVGQWLGAYAPDRFDRFVLASTSASFGPRESWDERIETVRTRGMAAIADSIIERWFTAEFRARSPEAVAGVRDMLLSAPPLGYVGACAAVRDADLREVLGEIQARVLVIGGRHDPVSPPERLEEVASAVRADVRLLDAAHLVNVEQADAFNAAVEAFLD